MNTKKVIKRLSAVGAGAIMLGATVMGAFAADLSDYPDMFVSDGTFDGYFVVGEAAASVDNLAMTDIATNMYYVASDSESTTTTVEGDAWLAATSSNYLELEEHVASVESYLDESHLGALADGKISNSKGVADYEQFLYFNGSAAKTAYQEDDDDGIGFFYKIGSGAEIATYLVDFTTSLESDITAGVYDDIEDETVTLMGKEFTIVTATNETAGPKLILMGGAASDTLDEGDTASYVIGDTTYEVEVVFVDADEAQFSINGETTNKLKDGETDVLDDAVTNIGVTEILYQDYAGGVHSVTFFLGADKLELAHGSSMKYNEETISDAEVTFSYSEASGDITIDNWEIRMTAEDDLYVGEGGKLSENVNLDEPGVLFTGNWDIELSSVESSDMEITKLAFSESDEQADLRVTLSDGDVAIPLMFANSTTNAVLGEKDGEYLKMPSFQAIEDEDYFILSSSDPDTASNDARSYLLQYKGADKPGDDNPKVRVKNIATSETYERSMNSDGSFDLKLGGTAFNFGNASTTLATATKDHNLNLTSGDSFSGVTADGNATSGDDHVAFLQKFRTAANHEVEININESGSGQLINDSTAVIVKGQLDVVIRVDDTDLYDNSSTSAQVVMNATIKHDSANGELDTTSGTVSFGTLVSDPDDSDLQYGRSRFGESYIVSASGNSGGPSSFTVEIPDAQSEVMLYVTSGATSSSTSVSGDLALVSVVDATRLDSEVSDVSAQNMVVVGGPCVNTVAAELMGDPSDCTEGFTPGVASVKLFESGDSVSMLVAGYSGTDTRLAGRVMAHRWDELSGEAVEIEGTTYSDATIAEPSMEEEEEAEEESSEE